MSRIAQVTGSNQLATVTIPGIAGLSTRIYGFTGTMKAVDIITEAPPSITISNCLDYTGATFTLVYHEQAGRAGTAASRGPKFLPGREYEIYGPSGATMTVIYKCGSANISPFLCVWFDQIGGRTA